MEKRTILYCNCSFKDLIPDERKQTARDVLAAAGANVVAVADLCERVANDDPMLAELAAAPSLTIIACYPRAVQWLFLAAGHKLPDNTTFVNLRTDSMRDLADQLGVAAVHSPSTDLDDAVAVQGDWVPWFPVIDYDKCANCKQCLSFCPFGVYSQSNDGKVVVTQPRNCKNNCPACARVCPACAIIFPKVIDTPINGAEVKPEDLEKAKDRLEEQKRELEAKVIHNVLAQRKLRALARRMAREYTQEALEEIP